MEAFNARFTFVRIMVLFKSGIETYKIMLTQSGTLHFHVGSESAQN